MDRMIRVTVWNENRHEKTDERVRRVYPEGIHGAVSAHLNRQEGIRASTATLDEPEHGLTAEVLSQTDVLTWWGHCAHAEVSDAVVGRVRARVLEGMGLVCLHSAHLSKIFTTLMGTSGSLRWRDIGEKERVWTIEPGHPIAAGIGDCFEIAHEEMYGERFDIPAPEKVVFISWFEGGEVFRSGCTWERGNGRVFYFRPGHETYPVYHDTNVLRIITNAVRWAAPRVLRKPGCSHVPALEQLRGASE